MKLLAIHWSEENAFGPPLEWLAGGISVQCVAMVHSGNKTESSLQYRQFSVKLPCKKYVRPVTGSTGPCYDDVCKKDKS